MFTSGEPARNPQHQTNTIIFQNGRHLKKSVLNGLNLLQTIYECFGCLLQMDPNKEIFLSNERNKSQFIALVSRHLEANSFIVIQCAGDADMAIVETVLEYAALGTEVTLVADDTDVLVLLMHHWKEHMADVFFHSEARKSQNTPALTLIVRRFGDQSWESGLVAIQHLLILATLLKKIKASK